MFENIAFNLLSVHKVTRNPLSSFNSNRSHHALSFRLSGESRFSYRNIQELALKGSIAYIPAYLDYSIQTNSDEELIILHLEVYNYKSDKIEIFNALDYAVFKDLFEAILFLWECRDNGYKHKCSSILYNIFSQIEIEANSSVSSNIPLNFKHSIDYMHHNFTDSCLSIRQLAEIACVSEVYFRRIFTKNFRKSPLKYINDMRISYACELLKSKYYTISEVAEKSGFPDPKYFSTKFKHIIGVSPSEFI